MANTNMLKERTLSGFIWLISGSSVQVILKLVVLAILARLVTPQEFGIMGAAVLIIEFSKLFTQMGIGPALIQRKTIEERHLTTGLTLSLLMGLLCATILALTAPFVAYFFQMRELVPILRIVSFIFLIDSVTLVGHALLQRHLKFRKLALLEVVSYTGGFGIVGVALAFQGWGVWALVAAHLAQAILQAILVTLVQPFPKRLGFHLNSFKELIYFGGGMTIGRIGNYFASQGDNFVIGHMLGSSALGIYGRAYQFMVMPVNLFGAAIDKTLFPAMSKVQDDRQKLGEAYITGVSSIALVAIPFSILSVILAPEIVMVVLGPNWGGVILPFQILASSLLFRMSYKMSDSLARATGAIYKRAWRQVIFAIMVITGSYIGQFWGLPGVACAVAAALILNFFLMLQLSIRLTDITWASIAEAHKQSLLSGMVTITLATGIVNICRHSIKYEAITLAITLVTTMAILLSIIYFLPDLFLRSAQKELLKKPFLKHFKNYTLTTYE